jgi:hypothetical protein
MRDSPALLFLLAPILLALWWIAQRQMERVPFRIVLLVAGAFALAVWSFLQLRGAGASP